MYLELLQSIGGETLVSQGKKLCAKDSNLSGTDDAAGLTLQALGKFVKTTDFGNIKDLKSIRNIAKTLRMVADQLDEAADKA